MTVRSWLENEEACELYTLKKLHEKMHSYTDLNSKVYTIKRLKQKLKESYGKTVYFTEIAGQENVI